MNWHKILDKQARELLVDFVFQGKGLEQHEVLVAERAILQMATLLNDVERSFVENSVFEEILGGNANQTR